MSLDWSVAKCKNHEALIEGEEWHITEALIWGTMSVDLGRISEENITEFYARISVWESIVGAFVQYKKSKDEPVTNRYITMDDLHKRIGMYTNVTSTTRAEWLKRLSLYFKNKLEANKRDGESYLKFIANPTPTK